MTEIHSKRPDIAIFDDLEKDALKTAPNLIDPTKALMEILPWQLEDARFVSTWSGGVLGHRTGAGKTLMAIVAWALRPEIKRTLILGTRSSISTWRKNLLEWADTPVTILQGRKDDGWLSYEALEEGVWICTFATFRDYMESYGGTRDRAPQVDLIIVDELHRILRSKKTKFYSALTMLWPKLFIGLSATWASRGPQDLWPVLHFISRKVFPSYWRFVETFCFVEKTQFGTEIFGVRNAENLRKLMRSKYYASRPIAGFKGIRREAVPLDFQPKWQKKYDILEKDMILEMEGVTVVTPNSLAKLTRLLQLSISPKVLDPSEKEYGPVVTYIVEQVSDDPHTVIYTPYREAIEVFREALVNDGYPPENIFTLQGGDNEDDIDRIEKRWKETRGALLCTITFAQSFRVDTSDTAYFAGFSWDPNDNIQAEGRLEAINSKRESPALCRYVYVKGTAYESAVLPVLDGKNYNVTTFLKDREAKHAEE